MLNKLASSIDERLIRDLIVLLQTAVAVKDQAASQAVGARLAGVAHVTGEMGTPTYIARHMGEAAALGGDRAAACAHYRQALGVARKIRYRPETAPSRCTSSTP